MNIEFKPTFLYVKTHLDTGLKYFGKTTLSDPHKYKGSGKKWLNHLRKHGYNVYTKIVGYYTDKEECRMVALNFSAENNIVESKEWANLTIENGLMAAYEQIPAKVLKYLMRCLKLLFSEITYLPY
jgi:hypothetical protein